MATNEDEILDLKRRARRRLVGAVALLLFLVIVPPWVMDLEPQPVDVPLEIEIPKPEAGALPAVPDAPVPTTAAEKAPTSSAVPQDAKPAAADATPPTSPAAAGHTPATTASAPKHAPPKAVEPAPHQAYIVPLATLANKANVKDLQAKAALSGIRTYTEPIKTAAGEQTRVRAGPFETEAEAEQARQRLSGLGLKPGKVTTR